MDNPTWVPRVALLAAHFEQLREHGGLQGLRDMNGLEAALARPKHKLTYEPESDVADLAAAYLFAFARSQHFNDGNKRVALAATLMFLDLNGYELSSEVTDDDVTALLLGVARQAMSEEACAGWLRERLKPAPPWSPE